MQKLSRASPSSISAPKKQDSADQKVCRSGLPAAPAFLTCHPVAVQPSCICLKNLAFVKDIDEDFGSEILLECEKFGKVLKIVVSAQNKSSPPNSDDMVIVYVQFDSYSSATKAQAALDGRFFAGRIVQAETCDSLFLNANLAHAIRVDEYKNEVS